MVIYSSRAINEIFQCFCVSDSYSVKMEILKAITQYRIVFVHYRSSCLGWGWAQNRCHPGAVTKVLARETKSMKGSVQIDHHG